MKRAVGANHDSAMAEVIFSLLTLTRAFIGKGRIRRLKFVEPRLGLAGSGLKLKKSTELVSYRINVLLV